MGYIVVEEGALLMVMYDRQKKFYSFAACMDPEGWYRITNSWEFALCKGMGLG